MIYVVKMYCDGDRCNLTTSVVRTIMNLVIYAHSDIDIVVSSSHKSIIPSIFERTLAYIYVHIVTLL